jgi:NAD(P)-dependent dehydrogenase (short-subunit alcohol dehydrogenase family)
VAACGYAPGSTRSSGRVVWCWPGAIITSSTVAGDVYETSGRTDLIAWAPAPAQEPTGRDRSRPGHQWDSEIVRRSYVVTGGGRGVGRAVVERLLGDGHAVVVIDFDLRALDATVDDPANSRLVAVSGSAADEAVTERAADRAQAIGSFAGWVNNAATFRDAALDSAPIREILNLIALNLEPTVVGCATAIRRFLAEGTPGAIVNVSSHQAQRAVRGALPYVTAKAATEGLTKALAVDYGPRGIRVNAVALGSITTERYKAVLAGHDPEARARIDAEMARLHPVGRVGQPAEAASAIAYLLSDEASFINGAILPVDGGRSVLGQDPEETD